MWKFASKCLAGTGSRRFKNGFRNISHNVHDLSDEEDDRLECPICCESFNIIENIPYVLWCGHSLCKNCVLALHWAVLKIHPLPIQLPLLISCPWCNLVSPRLVLRGNLKFPRKNYFLLWMVERINTDKPKSRTDSCGDCELTSRSQPIDSSVERPRLLGTTAVHNRVVGIRSCVWKAVLFFVELTAKFPLVLIFLMIVLYAIPASATILVLYVLLTILFALPSFLILYFSYPSLDWLVKEIMA